VIVLGLAFVAFPCLTLKALEDFEDVLNNLRFGHQACGLDVNFSRERISGV
jgi:hypothetical protein